jgi:branched-chain amino acid transport system substrate-binding protein
MKKQSLSVLSFIIAMSFFILTTSVNAAPGFDDKEIRIAAWGPQTGPAAAWGNVARGPNVMAAIINEEGGINGRKLKHFVRDDQYNPAQTKVVVKELVEQQGIFAFVCGTSAAGGMAVKDYLKENKVIWVGPATSVNEYVFPVNPYLFTIMPLYEDEASILTKYVVEKLKMKKIAVFYQNDAYGKNGLEGVRQRLKHYKMTAVAEIPVEPTEQDLGSQMQKFKSAGAEAVLMWVAPKTAVIALKTSKAMGYSPQWLSSDTLSDYDLMFKISGGLWEGVITGAFTLPPDSDNPTMVKYREAAKKYTPAERWGVFYHAGIMFTEPLIYALKKVGKNLSTEACLKELNKIKDFQGTGGKITWTPTRHQGTDSIMIMKCGPNATYVPLQGWTANELATWKKK